MKKIALIMTAAFTMLAAQTALAEVDTTKIFNGKCKMCHALDKKKTGPAFKDMNADAAVLKDAIANGRKMMPKFSGKLSEEEIDAMVAYIASTKEAAAK